MANTIFTGVARNYAATAQKRYKNSYRRRLMDRCILDDICNGNPENIKGFLGVGKGSEVEVYIPGTVKIRDTKPDGGIVYQQMTDTYETYTMRFESYWAVKRRPEDRAFMPFDPMSDTFTNAADMMARHQEKKFGDSILGIVPAYNRGHNAGATYRSFDLGDYGDPVVLYKTQRQVDEATGVQHRDVCADFIIKGANTIRQGEGLSGGHVTAIIPSPLKHHLQTSELKLGGLMGQRNIDLGAGERGGRNEVKFLGTMDDTITVVQDDIMFRDQVFVDANGHTNYPIFFMMPDACAYIHDTITREDAMKDIGNWDEHWRAKEVYDWPVLFPQMLAVAWVTLAEPEYTPAD